MQLFRTILALCLLPFPLIAQTGTGTITGTLDLDPARWVVASAGDRPTSAYSTEGSATEIRLVGTPDPEGEGDAGTLTIVIEAETGAVEARVTDVRIELQRDDDVLSADSQNIDLTLEAFQQAGDDLALAGSFVATLTPGSAEGLVVTTEAGVTLDGNFQATIPVASDD